MPAALAGWYMVARTLARKVNFHRNPLRPKLQYNRGWSSLLPKFEDCLQRLEKIVDELERGDIALEQALKLFEEGVQLSNSCRKELEEAEGKVEILLKQNGKLQAEPFEAAAEPAK